MGDNLVLFTSKMEIFKENLFRPEYRDGSHVYTMNKKSINKFAILVILMIAVPEAVGHTLFEKSHPSDSSVNAAIAFTSNLRDSSDKNGICHLMLENDQSDAGIARAAGLEGKYGDFSCV